MEDFRICERNEVTIDVIGIKAYDVVSSFGIDGVAKKYKNYLALFESDSEQAKKYASVIQVIEAAKRNKCCEVKTKRERYYCYADGSYVSADEKNAKIKYGKTNMLAGEMICFKFPSYMCKVRFITELINIKNKNGIQ